MLVQFAQMGAAYVAARFGTTSPTVGLLSIGEEPTKGTPLVKETHALLAERGRGAGFGFEFVGNLEGRDLLPSPADVIVTDGFTGNVALKALEGSLRFLFDAMLGVFGTNDETKAAADVLLPYLLPMAAEFEPENTGGAMLLGIDGVCVISHGSSNAIGHGQRGPGGLRVRHPGFGGPCGGRRPSAPGGVKTQFRGQTGRSRPENR